MAIGPKRVPGRRAVPPSKGAPRTTTSASAAEAGAPGRLRGRAGGGGRAARGPGAGGRAAVEGRPEDDEVGVGGGGGVVEVAAVDAEVGDVGAVLGAVARHGVRVMVWGSDPWCGRRGRSVRNHPDDGIRGVKDPGRRNPPVGDRKGGSARGGGGVARRGAGAARAAP